MEGFLYTLAATFIVALATIAYKHPDSYKLYVAPTVGITCAILMIFGGGYFVGTTLARDRAAHAAVEAITSKHVNIYNEITQPIADVQIPQLAWLALFALAGYIRFLELLPSIGLTADSKHPSS